MPRAVQLLHFIVIIIFFFIFLISFFSWKANNTKDICQVVERIKLIPAESVPIVIIYHQNEKADDTVLLKLCTCMKVMKRFPLVIISLSCEKEMLIAVGCAYEREGEWVHKDKKRVIFAYSPLIDPRCGISVAFEASIVLCFGLVFMAIRCVLIHCLFFSRVYCTWSCACVSGSIGDALFYLPGLLSCTYVPSMQISLHLISFSTLLHFLRFFLLARYHRLLLPPIDLFLVSRIHSSGIYTSKLSRLLRKHQGYPFLRGPGLLFDLCNLKYKFPLWSFTRVLGREESKIDFGQPILWPQKACVFFVNKKQTKKGRENYEYSMLIVRAI